MDLRPWHMGDFCWGRGDHAYRAEGRFRAAWRMYLRHCFGVRNLCLPDSRRTVQARITGTYFSSRSRAAHVYSSVPELRRMRHAKASHLGARANVLFRRSGATLLSKRPATKSPNRCLRRTAFGGANGNGHGVLCPFSANASEMTRQGTGTARVHMRNLRYKYLPLGTRTTSPGLLVMRSRCGPGLLIISQQLCLLPSRQMTTS